MLNAVVFSPLDIHCQIMHASQFVILSCLAIRSQAGICYIVYEMKLNAQSEQKRHSAGAQAAGRLVAPLETVPDQHLPHRVATFLQYQGTCLNSQAPFLLCLCCRLQLPIDEFRERRVRCAKLLDMLISFSISPRAEPDGFCMKVDIGRHR